MLHLAQRVVYLLYRVLEIGNIAVLLAYCLFPVPLVDVERMEVVEVLEGAYGVHVGIESVAGGMP